MTDFRAVGTIMGLAGLTAVFGMGTGGAPPVSSPEFGRRGSQPRRSRWIRCGHTNQQARRDVAVAFIRDGTPQRVGVV